MFRGDAIRFDHSRLYTLSVQYQALKSRMAEHNSLSRKSSRVSGVQALEYVEDGTPPIFKAAITGDTTAVSAYLDGGGNVDDTDDWLETMLHKAALNDQVEMVQLLLRRGAQVNHINECMQTPMHYASIAGSHAVIQALIENGGDVNAVDKCRLAPMHSASIYGHVRVARLLKDKGADVDALDQHSMSPLHYSCANGHIAMVQFGIDVGAELDGQDENGKTPLHTACCWGESRIIAYLVNSGASVEMVDKAGKKPLEYCEADTLAELRALERGEPIERASTSSSMGHTTTSAADISMAQRHHHSTDLAEMEKYGPMESALQKQQHDMDMLRTKTSQDYMRVAQQQERQAWVLENEMKEREKQGEQLIAQAQHLQRYDTILKKTAFMHKEVAEQQTRAITQLQQMFKNGQSNYSAEKDMLGKRLRQDEIDRGIQDSKIRKLWEDSEKREKLSVDQAQTIEQLRNNLANREASLVKQQATIDRIEQDTARLKQESKKREAMEVDLAQLHSREEAHQSVIADKMRVDLEERELLIQQQAETIRSIEGKMAINAMEYERRHKAAADQHNAHMDEMMNKMRSGNDERVGLLDLTSKYYDILTKQQSMLDKLQKEVVGREGQLASQQQMINKLNRDVVGLQERSGNSGNSSDDSASFRGPAPTPLALQAMVDRTNPTRAPAAHKILAANKGKLPSPVWILKKAIDLEVQRSGETRPTDTALQDGVPPPKEALAAAVALADGIGVELDPQGLKEVAEAVSRVKVPVLAEEHKADPEVVFAARLRSIASSVADFGQKHGYEWGLTLKPAAGQRERRMPSQATAEETEVLVQAVEKHIEGTSTVAAPSMPPPMPTKANKRQSESPRPDAGEADHNKRMRMPDQEPTKGGGSG